MGNQDEHSKPSEATTITYSTCNSSLANSPPPVNCSDRTEAVITSTKRINLAGGFDDGQIQHVSCPLALPANQTCTVRASADNSRRGVIYSDTDIEIVSGDDGFSRDLFLYAPRGTLRLLADDDATDDAFRPNYRGSLWINHLVMGRETRANCRPGNTSPRWSGCNRATYFTELDFPPLSNSFFLPPGFPPSIFDWVARSSSSTSLF